jgi:hypothetical protein
MGKPVPLFFRYQRSACATPVPYVATFRRRHCLGGTRCASAQRPFRLVRASSSSLPKSFYWLCSSRRNARPACTISAFTKRPPSWSFEISRPFSPRSTTRWSHTVFPKTKSRALFWPRCPRLIAALTRQCLRVESCEVGSCCRSRSMCRSCGQPRLSRSAWPGARLPLGRR